MDIIEKIDARIDENLTELGKLKPTDPNAHMLCDTITALGNTRTNILKEDNTRLNNNEVNDINRMKVEVDHEKVEVERAKVKTEKVKIIAGIGTDIVDAVKCAAFCWIAYNGDKVSYAIRDIKQVATNYLKSRRH